MWGVGLVAAWLGRRVLWRWNTLLGQWVVLGTLLGGAGSGVRCRVVAERGCCCAGYLRRGLCCGRPMLWGYAPEIGWVGTLLN